MPIDCRLQRIEPQTRALHYYLDDEDECYFLGEYTSGQGYRYSEINQLISNLKKDVEKAVTRPDEFRYKTRAIRSIATCLGTLFKRDALEHFITLVPMPPSKTKSHPAYDDRVVQICTKMTFGLNTPDVSELIECTRDREPTHRDASKPPPQELMNDYRIVCAAGYQPRPLIMLVDDLITTGSHFKACKNVIAKAFPDRQIVGVFIARRVFPPAADDFSESF